MLGIEIAKKFIGLQEVTNNKELRALFHSQSIHGDLDIDPAKTSWCACWINFCERESGHPGNGHLNAQSFKTYGTKVDPDDAKEGDILVFHFPSDSDWQGHVTYFVKYNDDSNTVTCLGGNQHDSVNESNYSQDYITDIRRSP
jgi:uncharacterized protein (TIGR02594 family)